MALSMHDCLIQGHLHKVEGHLLQMEAVKKIATDHNRVCLRDDGMRPATWDEQDVSSIQCTDQALCCQVSIEACCLQSICVALRTCCCLVILAF